MFPSCCPSWASSLCRICFLTGTVLLAISPRHGHATPTSGLLEVDLIFPRNDTYAADTPLMPIIFAVQNPDLVASPLGATLTWTITEYNNFSGPITDYDTLTLDWINASTVSNPWLSNETTHALFNHEKTWLLTWNLLMINCSQTDPNAPYYTANYSGGQQQSIVFTTRNGAPAPDLVAATAANTCAATDALVFNVTATVASPYDLVISQPSCAAVAPGPPPKANPCAVQIDASLASSINAAATARACNSTFDTFPNITCPALSLASARLDASWATWGSLSVLGLVAVLCL